MAKLVEYITPTWIPEEGDKCIPIYDSSIDGERIELVRCKECEYGTPHTNYRKDYGMLCCNVRGSTNGYVHDETWFCGDGRKKGTK